MPIIGHLASLWAYEIEDVSPNIPQSNEYEPALQVNHCVAILKQQQMNIPQYP